MTPPAPTLGHDYDILPEVQRILESKKPELLAEWKTVDLSEFQPASVRVLQAALLTRLVRGSSGLRSPPAADACLAATEASEELSPVRSQPRFPLPMSIPTSPDFQYSQKQLDRFERNLADHNQRLEQLDRANRSLNLVIYNVPEKDPSIKGGAAAFQACEGDMDAIPLLENITSGPEDLKDAHIERIGRVSAGIQKARPIRVTFHAMYQKHAFLAYTKDLRQAGIRVDDDLTRLQQQQRQDLDGDFKILKAKGCKPFFRGSQLKCHVNNKLRFCSKGQATESLAAV